MDYRPTAGDLASIAPCGHCDFPIDPSDPIWFDVDAAGPDGSRTSTRIAHGWCYERAAVRELEAMLHDANLARLAGSATAADAILARFKARSAAMTRAVQRAA